MSETSTTSPVSPIQHRDIRSASKPSKRDKDHNQKWSGGQRPLHGVRISFPTPRALDASTSSLQDELWTGSNDAHRTKVRPAATQSSAHKRHEGNSTAIRDCGPNIGRVFRKVHAHEDVREGTEAISRSLMDLLPEHVNNTRAAVHTTVDDGVLYSFDHKRSPGVKGREVGLDALVEIAERKFQAEQTDRIVKGEYEVIDGHGETVLSSKKGKKSPRQRAKVPVVASALEEDDGFELV